MKTDNPWQLQMRIPITSKSLFKGYPIVKETPSGDLLTLFLSKHSMTDEERPTQKALFAVDMSFGDIFHEARAVKVLVRSNTLRKSLL